MDDQADAQEKKRRDDTQWQNIVMERINILDFMLRSEDNVMYNENKKE